MLFKDGPSGRLRREWDQEIHPDLRTILISFERWSSENGLKEPLITMLVRTRAEQVAIYVGHWQRLLAALEPGPRQGKIDPEGDGTYRPLTPREKIDAGEIRKAVDDQINAEQERLKVTLGIADREALTLQVLVERAERKFTWHWAKCAGDLRTTGGGAPRYTPAELARVDEWFKARAKQPQWEYLIHDVTAPHLHIGRRDFGWRAKFGTSSVTP